MGVQKIVMGLSLLSAVVSVGVAADAFEMSHGPYLLNPGVNTMSVRWVTPTPSGAALILREAGKTDTVIFFDDACGQVRYNTDAHCVTLRNLKPGTEYEYQLVNMDPKKCKMFEEGTYRKFTSFDPAKKNYRALFFSDIHNNSKVFGELLAVGESDKADFIGMIGDLSGSIGSAEKDIFKGYMDQAVSTLKSEKPVVMVRGNHEYRGGATWDWMKYLGTENNTTYRAFAHGNVFYIVLDSGEDKLDRTKGSNYTYFNSSAPYMEEQKNWLKEVMKSDAFKKADFRVVLTHIPTHGQADAFPQKRMREYFGALLNGTSSTDRIHLMLSGHDHRYMRVDAKTDKIKGFNMDKCVKGKDFNYTVVSNDGPGYGGVDHTLIVMDVTDDALTCTTKDHTGAVIDMFKVSKDGKIKDLMEIKSY